MSTCLSYVYAGYHLNASSGIVATDFSGNGRHGTLINMENGDWVAGKLNNCLQFDGINEYINLGDIADFERTDTFSFEFWIKTSSISLDILTRYTGGKGWIIHLSSSGKLFVSLRNSAAVNEASRYSSDVINTNSWQHVIVTYNGSSSNNGIKIYLNGSDNTDMYSGNNTLTDNISSAANAMIGARQGSTGLSMNGQLDEVIIYDVALTQNDVTNRWNDGNGTETFITAPPNQPSNPNPINNEIDVEYNRKLIWNCTHPDGVDMIYDVYLDTITPPIAKMGSDINVKEYSPANYEALQTYYWKIVAKDSCGNETASPVWQFDTRNESPITPSNPSPIHNSTGQSLSITLQWDSDDYNPSDTLTYDIYFGVASNPPMIKNDHSAKTYTLPPLSYDTRYYWKIVARDNHGATTASPIWNFTTLEEGLSGYTGFDVRQTIRAHFCKVRYAPGSELTEYYYNVEDERGDDVQIPMYLSEEVRSKELKEMPYLDMNLADSTFEVHDIGGSTRKKEAYIDVGLWYADTDNIDRTDFGNAVVDKLIDYVRSNQTSFTGINFINVESVRLLRETMAHQVVYHWVITLYCWYYDFC